MLCEAQCAGEADHLSPHWSCSLRGHTPRQHAVSAGHKHCSGHVLKSSAPARQVTFAADSSSHYPTLSPEMSQPLPHLPLLGNVHLSNTAHCSKKAHASKKPKAQLLFLFSWVFWCGFGFFSPTLFLCLQVQGSASHTLQWFKEFRMQLPVPPSGRDKTLQ